MPQPSQYPGGLGDSGYPRAELSTGVSCPMPGAMLEYIATEVNHTSMGATTSSRAERVGRLLQHSMSLASLSGAGHERCRAES